MTALGTIATQVLGAIPDVVVLFAPIFGLLAVLGIGLLVARKFGVKR